MQLGKKMVYFNLQLVVQHHLKSETKRWELKQRPWGMLLTGLLQRACSVCFLIHPRTTLPGVAQPKNELAPPTSMTNYAPQAGLLPEG